MSSINKSLSAAYGIMPFGKLGMEVIRNGVSKGKFTKKASQFENWQDALNFARTLGSINKPIKQEPKPVQPKAKTKKAARVQPVQDPDPEPFAKVDGEGGAQHTFDLKPGQQLALF